MATNYPGGIDDFNNPTPTDYLDSATVPHAAQHANANDAIEAVETELGTNPKGTYASVKARLDAATPNDTANEVVKRDANGEFVAGAVTIDTTKTPTSAPGKLYWDGGGTVNLGLAGGNVSVALGENLVSYVTNAEATTLAVGEVVYVFGASGDRPSVKRASNASEITSSKTLGIVAESIGANQIGFVITRGIIGGLALGSYTEGAPVYLGSTAGTFTSTKPVAPANLVALGWVIRANNGNGQIYVNVQNGFELEELHNVLITSAANGNFLVYDSATTLWKNQAISATAPVTYNAGTRTIAANSASTSASGVVQLSDSTSTTSSVLAATPTAVKAAYDLASTANATANAAIPLAQKAAANGVATLDASGLVPTNQLPALAITNTFVVNSQAAMLALTAETGDVAIRTDLSESYILTATPASTLANWQELLTPPDAVTSVDGRVGAVTLSDLYAAKTHAATHASAGSDPVTLAQSQITNLTTDLAAKAPLASPALTGVPTSTTAAVDTNTTQIATTAYVVGQGYLKSATASSTYAPIASPTFTGTLTTPNVIVTGSTVPANGIYLPAANTLGLATNSTVRLQIDSVGNLGIGIAPATAKGVILQKSLTGTTSSTGFQSSPAIQSDVTGQSFGFMSRPTTASSIFTVGEMMHFFAWPQTYANITAGGAVTIEYGFHAASTLTQAANNYGFFGNIPLGTGRWNFYGAGTAANYFAGQTTVGSTSLTLGSGSVAQQFGVVAGAATTVGAVIRGAVSQSANLTEWQNSAGGIVLRVDNAGGLRGTYIMSGNVGSGVLGQITAYAESAATVGLGIRGAVSQTADMLQVQNSGGTTLIKVDSGGNLIYNSRIHSGTSFAGAFNIFSRPNAASEVAVAIRAQASQVGDLLQFQDSNANILSSVNPAGTFVGNVQDSQLIQYGAEGSLLQNIPTRVHPAETLLKQAVWWIDSAHSGSSGQAIKNLGWGGSALDATAGSTTSADSNDPAYLEWSGTNYVYTPGVISNFISVPDANDLDITGDIDLRVQLAMDDWTPSAIAYPISKHNGTVNSYSIFVNTDGTLNLNFSVNGSTGVTATSVATGVADGTVKWIRATRASSTGTVKFYLSDNGTSWTQLGTDVSSTSGNLFAGTGIVGLGSRSDAANPLAGKLYRAQILNGIDGVPVLDVDTSVIASGAATSFTALTGQTVTINRSTSGRKTTVVTHPVWLFGTDDFMEVNNRWLERTTANYLYLPGVNGNYASSPDSAALDITGDIDLRVKVAMDDWTPTSTNMLLSKYSSTAGGLRSYQLMLSTSGFLNLQWSTDGSTLTNNIASTAIVSFADGAIGWVRATLDVDNGASGNTVTFFTSTDGTTWTQLGAVVTTAGVTSIFSGGAQLEVGTRNVGTAEPARGKFFRAQVLNGIGGTVAFDANFETGITTNLPTTFTESSANAATVTINYSGTGYRSAGVIASTYVFPGNPNTFKLSSYSLLDFGATDDFTMIFVNRQWATIPGGASLMSKVTANSTTQPVGYYLTTNRFVLNSDGTNNAVTESLLQTSGVMSSLVGVRNTTADTIQKYINSAAGTVATDTTTGTLQNNGTLLLRIADYEMISAAIFRRALTAAEIATLNSYFQGRVA